MVHIFLGENTAKLTQMGMAIFYLGGYISKTNTC